MSYQIWITDSEGIYFGSSATRVFVEVSLVKNVPVNLLNFFSISMLIWPAKEVNRILFPSRIFSVEEPIYSPSQRSFACSWLIWSIGSSIATGYRASLLAIYRSWIYSLTVYPSSMSSSSSPLSKKLTSRRQETISASSHFLNCRETKVFPWSGRTISRTTTGQVSITRLPTGLLAQVQRFLTIFLLLALQILNELRVRHSHSARLWCECGKYAWFYSPKPTHSYPYGLGFHIQFNFVSLHTAPQTCRN